MNNLTPSDVAKMMIDGDLPTLCFVNGELRRDLCRALQEGVSLEEGAFVDGFQDRLGIVLKITSAKKIVTPLTVLFYTEDSQVVDPVLYLDLEGCEQVALLEQYLGEGTYLVRPKIFIMADEAATLWHARLQRDSQTATHESDLFVNLKRGATVSSISLVLGAAYANNKVTMQLNGEGARSELYGLCVADGTREISNQTEVNHLVGDCSSYELYKGIYSDRSKGSFDGVIYVAPDAQKTDAVQTTKSILLSADAVSNATPQLKIYADDVKCAHGATVGQLDGNALFYLRSRGIPQEEARQLLLGAFAAEIIQKIEYQPLRGDLEGVYLF